MNDAVHFRWVGPHPLGSNTGCKCNDAGAAVNLFSKHIKFELGRPQVVDTQVERCGSVPRLHPAKARRSCHRVEQGGDYTAVQISRSLSPKSSSR